MSQNHMIQFDEQRQQKPTDSNALVAVEQSRAVQEVQAAMIIAKKFPRDENAAYLKIMNACRRPTLAEGSLYAYPKGTTVVTGPSIRMAEAIAQCWGNIDFGIRELEQANGESTVEAFCFDKETNTRQVKIFQVKHERHTKRGITKLKDPRDIYEMVANQGARRLRACILGVIPGDIIDAAVKECEKTMAGDNTMPLAGRIHAMVTAFGDLGVTQEMLEKRLGHNMDATSEPEVISLKKIFRSLKDGMSKREDFFEVGDADNKSDLNEAVATEKKKRTSKKSAPAKSKVKWAEIHVDAEVNVTMSDGATYSGTFKGENDGECMIQTDNGPVIVPAGDVASVQPADE